MPTGRSNLGVAAASSGKLYAIGGLSDSRSYLSAVEEYDPNTNVWTTRSDMPSMRRNLAVAAGGNGKLYAVGGSNWSLRGESVALRGPR